VEDTSKHADNIIVGWKNCGTVKNIFKIFHRRCTLILQL